MRAFLFVLGLLWGSLAGSVDINVDNSLKTAPHLHLHQERGSEMLLAMMRNPRGFVTGVGAPTGPCPVTVGPITLRAQVTRTTGISPLLAFYDATATTYSGTLPGANNTFQDITYTWNFGDSGLSGTGTWAYGSNPGGNVKNVASGAIAAHLYITQGADTSYSATVTAQDAAGNVASCTVGSPTSVVAYDPGGSNGFPGVATTCVSSTVTPVAGSGGCPSGAGVLNQSSFATAISTKGGAGKRVLFRCTDTFTGADASMGGVKWSYDAYGGCEGTQTNRPIFSAPSTSTAALIVATTGGDGRISNIDIRGAGTGNGAVNTGSPTLRIPYQITMYNLADSGTRDGYQWGQGAQYGVIGSTQVATRGIGTYINELENNPPYSGNTFNNLNYQAILGDSLSGPGGAGSPGIEAIRISAGKLMVIENSTFSDSNSGGAPFKAHNGDTYGSCDSTATVANGPPARCVNSGNASGDYYPCVLPNVHFATTTCWTGDYTELIMFTDNVVNGTGGNAGEFAPQNSTSDERLRNIVMERNFINLRTQGSGTLLWYVSGALNTTLRNNVFNMTQTDASHYPITAIGVGQRAANGINSSSVEIYNNTCYSPNSHGQTCIVIGAIGDLSPGGTNSFASNNLAYFSAGGTTNVSNTGVGNTVSNNSGSVTTNPAFTNGSGTFSALTDFKPTANYTISCTPFPSCTAVPDFFDALNVAWSPQWNFGAVHN